MGWNLVLHTEFTFTIHVKNIKYLNIFVRIYGDIACENIERVISCRFYNKIICKNLQVK